MDQFRNLAMQTFYGHRASTDIFCNTTHRLRRVVLRHNVDHGDEALAKVVESGPGGGGNNFSPRSGHACICTPVYSLKMIAKRVYRAVHIINGCIAGGLVGPEERLRVQEALLQPEALLGVA